MTKPTPPILGAHQSIAGGHHRAVERAAAVGCSCVQLFTKNNNQWRAAPLPDDAGPRFQAALRRAGIRHTVAHNSYLINLASPDRELWRRSVEAMLEELRRADALGIPGLVAHPGAHTTGTERGGLSRIVRAIDRIHRRGAELRSRIMLETTAGQGTCLGWRFQHLAEIIQRVREPERLGVCFDTCHVFAAGYDLRTRRVYRATMRKFDRVVGLNRIEAIHLNDSRRDLGSRVDRHEHIGRGHLGEEAFEHLLHDRRLRHVPMYLETPKGKERGTDNDVLNLRTLRRLAARGK